MKRSDSCRRACYNRGVRTVLLILLSLTIGISQVRAAKPVSKKVEQEIATLIDGLGDPDPAIRQKSASQLQSRGASARPALVRAARSPSPQIASRASEILMQLPWWLPTDPKTVQDYLKGYGQANNDARLGIIGQLFQSEGGEAALLRLAVEEPSDTVAWAAAIVLGLVEDESTTKMLRDMDLTGARVQVKALAGKAILPVDRPKAMQILRQAVEEDSSDDGSDTAQLQFAYNVLVANAIETGKLNEAADLLRSRIRRVAANADAKACAYTLFAFFADYGTAELQADDLQEFSAFLGQPEVMYAFSRMERNNRAGSNLLADVFGYCAGHSLFSSESHLRAGLLFVDSAWDQEGQRELNTVLELEKQAGDEANLAYQLTAHIKFARLIEVKEDHRAVAEHIEEAIHLSEKAGVALRFDPQELAAQANWHRMHLARDANNAAEVQRYLQKLREVPNPDSDTAIEVFSTLKELGKQEEAAAYLQQAYDGCTLRLTPRYERANALNDIAWLSARCGFRTDKAVEYAERALALEPDKYAYIDTAATAYFANGNPARALELETRALAMRPNDPFVRKQLDRFRTALRDSKPSPAAKQGGR